jgi:hypothetical protein
MRIWRTSPALFMLLLVTFGLFLMHTLGHSRPAHQMSMDHSATTLTIVANPPAERDAPMGDVAALCVAILATFIVIALAVAFIGRCGRRDDRPGRSAGGILDAVRGPPKTPIGLTLADLSMLLN